MAQHELAEALDIRCTSMSKGAVFYHHQQTILGHHLLLSICSAGAERRCMHDSLNSIFRAEIHNEDTFRSLGIKLNIWSNMSCKHWRAHPSSSTWMHVRKWGPVKPKMLYIP